MLFDFCRAQADTAAGDAALSPTVKLLARFYFLTSITSTGTVWDRPGFTSTAPCFFFE